LNAVPTGRYPPSASSTASGGNGDGLNEARHPYSCWRLEADVSAWFLGVYSKFQRLCCASTCVWFFQWPSFYRVMSNPEGKRSAVCSFGLSATSKQYFSLRTNQPPAGLLICFQRYKFHGENVQSAPVGISLVDQTLLSSVCRLPSIWRRWIIISFCW
jgi:hypothetical protein